MKNKTLTLTILTVAVFSGILWAKKEPSIIVTADPAYLSPNNDNIVDNMTFHIAKERVKSVINWELQIRDSIGSVKKSFSGTKDIPDNIVWDGKDEFGAPSAEGIYDVFFKVWDKNNQLYESAPLRIILDLTPPTISLMTPERKIIIKNGVLQPVTFNFSAVDMSGISNWKLQLLDQNRKDYFTEIATGPLPSSWILSDPSVKPPVGKTTAILWVADLAGNKSSSPPLEMEVESITVSTPVTAQKAVPVIPAAVEIEAPPVPVKPASAVVPKAVPIPAPAASPKTIQVPQAKPPEPKEEKQTVQTVKAVKYDGPFLQMTTIISLSDLFGNNADKRSVLQPQASILLEPLANAMLLSPGARAIILGHVDKQKNTDEDKLLSSFFAWKTFSYFVKQKGVDKDSVSVKGMGANVPIADNKTSLGRSRNRRMEIQIFLPREAVSSKE